MDSPFIVQNIIKEDNKIIYFLLSQEAKLTRHGKRKNSAYIAEPLYCRIALIAYCSNPVNSNTAIFYFMKEGDAIECVFRICPGFIFFISKSL